MSNIPCYAYRGHSPLPGGRSGSGPRRIDITVFLLNKASLALYQPEC